MPHEENTPQIAEKCQMPKQPGTRKTKKGRNSSGPGTAENRYDLCKGHERSGSSIAKLGLEKGPTQRREAEGQLPSSKTPPNISPNTPGKMKESRKRKRTYDDAVLDESVDSETDIAGLKPRRNKKRDEDREDWMNHPPCSDPAIDETLSEQSCRALSYAYEHCRGSEAWKFNKARQNWLLRNVWSEQAIPNKYIPLLVKYLVDIRGGAREKLIGECVSRIPTCDEAPMPGAHSSDYSANLGVSTVDLDQQPIIARAVFIRRALNKTN